MDTIKNLNPLIDCDPITYAGPAAAESQLKREGKEKGMSPEQIAEYIAETDFTAHALSNVKTAVDFILEQFPERQYYKAYLTGDGNFRHAAATILPYKGNRDKLIRPKYYQAARDYLVSHYDAEIVEGQEADDAIGIFQYSKPDKSTVICSIDKDLWLIPGYHYVPSTGWGDNKKPPRFFYQTLDEANEFLLYQMMTGDRVDNIPGINGIGPVKANKILTGASSYEEAKQAVEFLYQEQYGSDWRRAFDEVATLLWIRRKEGDRPNV